MQYADTTIIIILAVILVLVVSWVVFNIGRFVVFIIRFHWRARRPPRQLQHPELGVLTFDSNLWSGQIKQDGRAINLTVAGAESGPDTALVQYLRDIIARFPEHEQAALDFICSQEPGLRNDNLTVYSLDFLCEKQPDNFVLEFTLAGDVDGIWRVEFEAGQPKYVGRDD